jgi:OHCU decarboxylase
MGRPGRAAALRRVIEYMKSHKDVWFATRLEIAQHWAKENPAMTTATASQMTRETFISEFGGIFEHSAWIADSAFDLELGPTHDNAQGVHHALARIFRSATKEQRLGVLTAHPDLAGKLAAAKRLTAESTAEQAAAGLDALTAEEHASFTELNNAYTTKFGFPFIIAVRDNTKATIMAAFKRRINNDRDMEFSEACKQVERIAELRMIEKFGV